MAKDIYRKHEFVPGPIGISWCDVTEDGHLCGRRAHHAIHQPRGRKVATDTRESAYRAGWNASKRSTTYDLDAAERRYDRNHKDVDNMFSAGWCDFAIDRPYGWALSH